MRANGGYRVAIGGIFWLSLALMVVSLGFVATPAGSTGLWAAVSCSVFALVSGWSLWARIEITPTEVLVRNIRTRRFTIHEVDQFVVAKWGQSSRAAWLQLSSGRRYRAPAADLTRGGTKARVASLNAARGET